MQTPTILRVSLEPFCPFCDTGVKMQGEFIGWTEGAEDFIGCMGMTLDLVCTGCGRMLGIPEILWREREKEEAE